MQLRAFDLSKAGTKPLWCLQNVRLGYGIASYFNDAWTAWTYTEQHPDHNFPKADVPVFFEFWITIDGIYKNWGHIAVRLSDGRVWTDGKFYASVQDLNDKYLVNGRSRYVGWGESVNEIKVITQGEQAMKIGSENNWRWRFNRLHRQLVRNGDMNDTVWKSIIGQDPWKIVESWSSHPEADQLLKDSVMGEIARKENWQGKITELGKVIVIKDNEIASLKAQVGDNTKWETLKALIRELIGR